MQATATLYTRTDGKYSKVEFHKRSGLPIFPADYAGTFYLRLSDNGKRTWRPFKDSATALTYQATFNTNVDLKRKGLSPLPAVEVAPTNSNGSEPETIAAAVEKFIAYCESREADWHIGGDNGLAPNSVVAYRKAMQNFAAACAHFNAVHMSEFQNADRANAILMNFKTWLKANVKRKPGELGLAKAVHSDSRKFTVVGQFLARIGIKMKSDKIFNPTDPGIVKHSDIPRAKKKTVKEVVYYTPEDLKALFESTNTQHDKSNFRCDDIKDLLMLLLCTGMRDEEVQHLTWSDINWANGDGKMKITVQDKPQWQWRVKDHEKRIVPPDKNAILKARLLARQAGKGKRDERVGSDLVFPTHLGTPDQNFADRISACIKRAQKAGYKFSHPEAACGKITHRFRSSYATYQHYVHNIPQRTLQHDLGHSDGSTTEGYLAYISADEIAAVRKGYTALDKLLAEKS
jgi:integrase